VKCLKKYFLSLRRLATKLLKKCLSSIIIYRFVSVTSTKIYAEVEHTNDVNCHIFQSQKRPVNITPEGTATSRRFIMQIIIPIGAIVT